MSRRIIQVEEKVPLLQGIPLSLQHLFAMFGASVLVPTLFKIDPAIVLLMNGTLSLRSALGRGTTMSICLPRAAIM